MDTRSVVDLQSALPALMPGQDAQVEWTTWARCESSFSFLLVPHKPGVLALAEEVSEAGAGRPRLLAMFSVEESDDLARSISQMFLPGSALRQRLGTCRCFVRYSVISDAGHRRAVRVALERWLEQVSDRAAGLMNAGQPDEPYIVAPQHHFLQSDFADSDPGDCAVPATVPRAIAGLRPPPFPQGF